MINSEKEKLIESEPPTSLLLRATILTYEIGSIVKCLAYAARFPSLGKTYLAASQTDIGDAIVQIELLCRQLGFDFESVRSEGWEHLKERYDDFVKDEWASVE